ncbi:type 2 isopentenyl-diphosphate Delta-isomerase [Ignavibacteria bacterium]|nr:type 2 isopentenyl-diphosphate Delta-isomerase [Bacteroidota bacterium]MCZ2132439.1 type 2 isopentenyl-diphosphate Delta-isomerase [Bacteroidota bacterium]
MNEYSATADRKREHIELCTGDNVRFTAKTAGFERYSFVHNALPELNFDEISVDTDFLGKKLQMPLLISCMTGGCGEAERINAQLAEAAERCGVAIGVGSQRQALENGIYHGSFAIVRRNAPSVPIIGNIGGDSLTGGKLPDVDVLVRLIDADAIAVHLNPLQELLQPEGNPRYRGVLDGIVRLVRESPVPVIVKEVGAGLSRGAGRRLLEAGVAALDCAGAGGTSWAGVEILRHGETLRKQEQNSLDYFWNWGIPTAECIRGLAPLKNEYGFTLIGSGGITNGVEAATALALGADITAAARPFLQAVSAGGSELLVNTIRQWQLDIRRIMFLTGAKTPTALCSSLICAG